MDLITNYCDCGSRQRAFSQEHDVYYCHPCNKWLEEKCDDEECEYCRARPPKPSDCEPIPDVGTESVDRKL